MSDYSPIALNWSSAMSHMDCFGDKSQVNVRQRYRLRRNKCYRSQYYSETYSKLRDVELPKELLYCHPGCSCDVQDTIDTVV